MYYVALSKLKSISGLHMLNMNQNKIAVSKKVQEEMNKILFQNVRLLRFYFSDVGTYYNVMAADVNIFVETALCGNANNALYEIPHFKLFRNDFMQQGTRTLYGTAVYVKSKAQIISQPLRCNYNDVDMMLLKVNHQYTIYIL